MYYRSRERRVRGRSTGYLMPFLILICVGVILVLGFNLWKSIFSEDVKGDAFLHVDSGSVQIKMWGSEDFLNFTSDTLVMEGDEIRVSAGGKVILEFFDGTILRLDGDANIILNEIDSDGDAPMINVILVNGNVWFNKLYKDTGDTAITVTMSNVVVNSDVGSIFELENDFDEVVRVLHGEDVSVDILSESTGKVVDTESIGVGQEIVFTDKVLERYLQYQSPSVLQALSDEFKQTDWYLWNDSQDKEPSEIDKSSVLGGDEFVEVAPEVFEVEEESDVDESGDVEADDSSDSAEDEVVPEVEEEDVANDLPDLGELTTPTIDSVSGMVEAGDDGFYVVNTGLATLKGSVSGADKVVVNGFTLQKFSSGDTTWTYYANADYGYMEEGDNTYEVYAFAPNGEKSDPLYVKVRYTPPVVEPEPEPEPELVEPDSESEVESSEEPVSE